MIVSLIMHIPSNKDHQSDGYGYRIGGVLPPHARRQGSPHDYERMNEETNHMDGSACVYNRYEGQADNPTIIQYYTELYGRLAEWYPQVPEKVSISTNINALHEAWRRRGYEPFYWIDECADEATRREVLKSLMVIHHNEIFTLPGPQERREENKHNEFFYPEFMGYAGFCQLKEIIKKIVRSPMFNAWETIYQTHNTSEETSDRLVLTWEKFNPYFAEVIRKGTCTLKNKGLLRQKQNPDGTFNPDFSELYRLAHEYFLWSESVEYNYFQPDIKAIARIHLYPDIYHYVLRFENYSRILNSKKAEELLRSGEITVHTW